MGRWKNKREKTISDIEEETKCLSKEIKDKDNYLKELKKK